MIKYVSGSTDFVLRADWDRRIIPRSLALHSYEWTWETTDLQYGKTIDQVGKDPQKYNVKLSIKGTKAERDSAVNAMEKAFESDVIYQKIGRFYDGNEYIEAYVQSASFEYKEMCLIATLTLYCPYPFWITEDTFTIDKVENKTTAVKFNNIVFNNYKFPVTGKSSRVEVDHHIPSNFTLTAYGPFDSLNVTIGGHPYRVYYSIAEGERLVIDSRDLADTEKRIYIIRTDGSTSNVFNFRDNVNSVFTKIQPGQNAIQYDRSYKIILTLYKERSIPKWH